MIKKLITKIKNKGQIVAEYSILIGIIVAALIVMNMYIKRAMQARLKDAADMQMSRRAGETRFSTRQYEPEYYSFRSRETTSNFQGNEEMFEGGAMSISQTGTTSWVGTTTINDTH